MYFSKQKNAIIEKLEEEHKRFAKEIKARSLGAIALRKYPDYQLLSEEGQAEACRLYWEGVEHYYEL